MREWPKYPRRKEFKRGMRGDTTQSVFPQFIKKKKQINPLAGGRQSGLARAWQYTVLLDTWERNIRGRKEQKDCRPVLLKSSFTRRVLQLATPLKQVKTFFRLEAFYRQG